MPIASITLLEGATPDRKRAAIASVTRALSESLDLPPASVRVILTEVPASHWGVGGKSLADTAT